MPSNCHLLNTPPNNSWLQILPCAHKVLKKIDLRAGDMAQFVECLPHKCESLSSNPSNK
jgi:hypothetical protein